MPAPDNPQGTNNLKREGLYFSAFGESLIEKNTNYGQFSSPYRFNGKELDPETGNYYYGARYYNPVWGVWLGVDPMAHLREWVSPYNFCQNNPIRRVDPTGALDDDYIFNENGDYVRTDVTNKPDRLVVENSKTGATQSYQFADPDADPKAIADGTINKVVFVSVAKAGDIMGQAGAFDATNRENEWSYLNTESKGGGKLDFSYSAIPGAFPGASSDPLTRPSSMLFIPEGDGYAHNHMNFGNFLWGASGHSLGFSETTLRAGAHYNSVMNPGTNGYSRQLDSKDDQLSISRGVNFSKTNQFRKRTWTPTGGLSTPPPKKR